MFWSAENNVIPSLDLMLGWKYTTYKNAPRSSGHFYWLTNDCNFLQHLATLSFHLGFETTCTDQTCQAHQHQQYGGWLWNILDVQADNQVVVIVIINAWAGPAGIIKE